MDSFRANSGPVTVSIPFADQAGNKVVPSAIVWRLLDDEGGIVKSSASIMTFDPDLGSVPLTIDETYNTLSADEAYGFRRVEVTLTVGSASVLVFVDYLLDAPQPFVAGVNTFMTYETALVQARSLGSLLGWDAAPEAERKAAMFRAFDAMGSFTYRFRYASDEFCDAELTLEELAEADQGFADLKPSQIMDFRKAQLVQADYFLGGNQIEKDIGDGLQSSTIGEVSQFFRPRPTLTLPLCKAALIYVGKYICYGLRIGRA